VHCKIKGENQEKISPEGCIMSYVTELTLNTTPTFFHDQEENLTKKTTTLSHTEQT